MFTSWSEVSTPPELSTASVLSRPPAAQYSSRPFCVKPEVAALAHHPRAQLAAVDAHAVVGAVADLGVLLRLGLDVGADAAVVEQVDARGQDLADHLLARGRLRLDLEQRRASGESGIALAERSKMPPPALSSFAS